MKNFNWCTFTGMVIMLLSSCLMWSLITVFIMWLVGCQPKLPYIPAL